MSPVRYINWHYFEIWPKILVLGRNLVLFPFYFFCVPIHLSHLFSPWKRMHTENVRPGFHPEDIFAAASFNLISRSIGFILRSTLIAATFAILPLFLGISLVIIVVWPVLIGLSLPWYLLRKKTEAETVQELFETSRNNADYLAISTLKLPEGRFVFQHLGLNADQFIMTLMQTKNAAKPLDYRMFFQGDLRKNQIRVRDILLALAQFYPPFTRLLANRAYSPADVYQTAVWYEELDKRSEQPLVMDLQKMKQIPGIGYDWSYGYTPQFNTYARDLLKTVSPFPLLVGREDEITAMERVLMKTHGNNILLIGEPGTARHRLLETLAHRMLSGEVPHALSHKRILQIDMHALMGSLPSIPEVKSLAASILDEAVRAGNIISVIDDIDKFVTNENGSTDFSDVFVRFAESSVGMIGITTPSAFHRFIEPNGNFIKLFEKVEIFPPTPEILVRMLELGIVPVLEKRYRITVTYPAIKSVIELADRYITSKTNPDKVIDLLDQVALETSQKRSPVVLPTHVSETLNEKLHIAIGTVQSREKEKLLHLEDEIHKRVINQEHAIEALASALRRARLNVSNPNRPIGTFLFLGPTGVGKTETAKALAETYFGSEQSMVRLDMSQYQKDEGIERLIGSIKFGTAGELTSALLDHPYTILLLDEIEKSDPQVLNLLLTLIDEGYITDKSGKRVSAKNTIVIATSNAGAEHIRELVVQGVTGPNLQQQIVEYVQEQKIYSPEFLNRFDSVLVFTPLSEGHLREIARLMLNNLNIRLKTNNVSIAITPTLIAKLANLGYNPQYGGRAMRRAIAETIEDTVAKRLLAGDVKQGEVIPIDL